MLYVLAVFVWHQMKWDPNILIMVTSYENRGVSKHQQLGCLFNSLLRQIAKKISKDCIIVRLFHTITSSYFIWYISVPVDNDKWTVYNDRHISFAITWWRHQMETFSELLALCAGWIPLTMASDAELWCFFNLGLTLFIMTDTFLLQ